MCPEEIEAEQVRLIREYLAENPGTPTEPPTGVKWWISTPHLDTSIFVDASEIGYAVATKEFQRRLIRDAIEKTTNGAEAARLLKMPRTSLHLCMRRLGIRREAS